ncbi:GNAT family N-acetyltransferase [Rugosimonospora africana]|uniref:N-acetyltransferase n=1 Tax=Rugosimonospora africana TaxID=556532 RepID=A0A8J3QZ43_9ACTN|nr:GNAT family N-acetyltransferase [Rugosimonospora africana]GIH18802.1 N-acetyltransferase [Rugosimonospora africana]
MEEGQLRLEPVTPDNVGAACRMSVRTDQQDFVAPVSWSLAEAYVNPDTAWPRLVYRHDAPVGFVMGAFDPANEIAFFRCGIWRLNVAADEQRSGVGSYAVRQVLAEGRRRGFARATVLWVPKAGGPGPFYERLGFVPTGEVFHGEVVGAIDL